MHSWRYVGKQQADKNQATTVLRTGRTASGHPNEPLSDSTRSTVTPCSANHATARSSTPMAVTAFSSVQISA